MSKSLGWDALKKIYRLSRYYFWSAKALRKVSYLRPKNGFCILILLPEAGISLYIKALIRIGTQLKRQGHQVIFARCFNIFERCVFMDSQSLPIDATPRQKKLLCTYCYRSFDEHVVKNGFEYIDLRNYITKQDHDEIQRVIDENPKQPFNFKVETVNLAGILEYNFFLYLKKSGLADMTSQELDLWQQMLRSLYIGYKAINRLTKALNISHVIMFDAYSLNSVVKGISDQKGIRFVNVTFPFHKDIDVAQLKIVQKDILSLNGDVVAAWPAIKELAVSAHQIKEAVDDLIIRMTKRGTYTYSPSKGNHGDLITQLGLAHHRKIIVAYPSSPDEMEAILNSYQKRDLALNHPEDAFCDQFEWLDALIDFTESSSLYQLIIRVHPRMAPNHREKWGCVALNDFVERYSKPYRHVKMVWPDDPISSYDLGEIADVVSVAWSSLGAFMARLGIPVVSGLKYSMPLPNDDFHVFCRTKPEFFQAIHKLCELPFAMERITSAYRWYNMIALGHCINWNNSENAAILEKTVVGGQDILQVNIARLQAMQEAAVQEEQSALRSQIFRLIHFFMTNKDDYSEKEFDVTLSFEDDNATKYYCLNVNSHHFCIYRTHDQLFKKHSPLVSRLVKLLNPRISIVNDS